MRITNNKDQYGYLAILFHWVSAVCVIGLFVLGYWMVTLDYYDPWYTQGPWWHKGLGIVLSFWLMARFIWKMCNPHPHPLGKHHRLNQLIKVAHSVLYLLLLLILVTGYLIVSADSQPIDVLGWFNFPADWQLFDTQETVMGDWHRWLAYVLAGIVVVHVLGALKHHFIDRDNTLRRMLGKGR